MKDFIINWLLAMVILLFIIVIIGFGISLIVLASEHCGIVVASLVGFIQFSLVMTLASYER